MYAVPLKLLPLSSGFRVMEVSFTTVPSSKRRPENSCQRTRNGKSATNGRPGLPGIVMVFLKVTG